MSDGSAATGRNAQEHYSFFTATMTPSPYIPALNMGAVKLQVAATMGGATARVGVMREIQCDGKVWQQGLPLGNGAMGTVYEATGPQGEKAVVKLVRKEPGASRELLFEVLTGAENVVPIWDRGEIDGHYALVMPRAECDLASELTPGVKMPVSEAVAVLTDIATALVSIEGRVVHRDLKPANVLLLDGRWCLADFGIARYAEDSTSEVTRKAWKTSAYAAPEQWRMEHATSATDVYAFGVIAYELLSGGLPFTGSEPELRELHLYAVAPRLDGLPTKLASLVTSCMDKSPQARPSSRDVLHRLQRVLEKPRLQAAEAVAQVDLEVQELRAAASAAEARQRTDEERRTELAESAKRQMRDIGAELLEVITSNAPTANVVQGPGTDGWQVSLGSAVLKLGNFGVGPANNPPNLPFDVIIEARLTLEVPTDASGYQGRSHSLYYCDAQAPGTYVWFETAFWFLGRQPSMHPFAKRAIEAAGALNRGLDGYGVAWPFTKLVPGDMDEFIERWLDWLSKAARGALHQPGTVPERNPAGSWRQS